MSSDRKEKKNILYVLHADFCKDAANNRGGTQFHVKNLVDQLKDVYNVYVLARDDEYVRFTDYSTGQRKVYKFLVGKISKEPVIYDEKIRDIVEKLLETFPVDLVHVHHTIDLSFDIFKEVWKRKIPMVMTIHDYFYICPTIKLLDQQLQFCGEQQKKEKCDKCLKKVFGLDAGFLEEWQKVAREMLSYCEKLIFPSYCAKEVMTNYYPEFSDKMQVIYHGLSEITRSEQLDLSNPITTDRVEWNLDEPFGKGWALLRGAPSIHVRTYIKVTDKNGLSHVFFPEKHYRADVKTFKCENSYYGSCGFWVNGFAGIFAEGPLDFQVFLEYEGKIYTDGIIVTKENVVKKADNVLKIAFLGGVVPAKGSKIIKEMILSNSNEKEIMWYTIGDIGDEDLEALKQNNLVKIGNYNQDMVQGLLNGYGIDFVCLLPVWAETFSYTLSESIISGVPVVATDIGAISERVKTDDIGFLVDVDIPPSKIVEEILDIWNNRKEEYEQKKKNITKIQLKSLEEMAEEYKTLYDTFSYKSTIKFSENENPWLMTGEKDAKEIKIDEPEVVIGLLEEKVADLSKQVTNANAALQSIYTSPAYKLALKISSFRIFRFLR
ncbi:MAG: glycosyltransferase [Lachnospiraceae bacterium]|nr:glycosyltransferase [Lachnospiraceae bacterium]